jgi:hypothetical protein
MYVPSICLPSFCVIYSVTALYAHHIVVDIAPVIGREGCFPHRIAGLVVISAVVAAFSAHDLAVNILGVNA